MKDNHDMTAAKIWACTAAGGCATSFITGLLPWLQFVAVCISIIAGIQSLRSRKS